MNIVHAATAVCDTEPCCHVASGRRSRHCSAHRVDFAGPANPKPWTLWLTFVSTQMHCIFTVGLCQAPGKAATVDFARAYINPTTS